MNVKTLTQKNIDDIFWQYTIIAFCREKLANLPPTLADFINYVGGFCGSDGYRLGIQGWPHTKLKIGVGPNGRLRFRIYDNGDNFTAKQKKILKRLKKWAERLNDKQ